MYVANFILRFIHNRPELGARVRALASGRREIRGMSILSSHIRTFRIVHAVIYKEAKKFTSSSQDRTEIIYEDTNNCKLFSRFTSLSDESTVI